MGAVTLITLILLQSFSSFGSSCCGSGQTNSSLILSEQKFILQTSVNYSDSIGRIFESKDFFVFKNEKKRVNKGVSVSASYVIHKAGQLGLSTAFSFSGYNDSFGSQSDENLSDTVLSYSYKVKGRLLDYFFTGGIVLPTGRSAYEKGVLSENTNVTGLGQYGTLLGVTLYKVKFPFTLLADVEYQNYFNATVGESSLRDVNSLRSSVFLGYSFGEGYSLGSGLIWNYFASHKVNDLRTDLSKFTTVNLTLSKSITEKISIAVTYADQTLLGGAKNTLLERVLGVNYIYNFF